jgi:glycosyltransferase involved in cell wall biosynthesis
MNEGENLRVLLPEMRALLERGRLACDIIVADGGSTYGTEAIAAAFGARQVSERRPGYAGASETGFAEARGKHLLTLDADMSHAPVFVAKKVAGIHAWRNCLYRGSQGQVTCISLGRALRHLIRERDGAME